MQIKNVQQQNFKASLQYDGPHTKRMVEDKAYKEIRAVKIAQAKINETIDVLNEKEIKEKIKRLPQGDSIELSTCDENGNLAEPYFVYIAENPNSVDIEDQLHIIYNPYLNLKSNKDLRGAISNWLDSLLKIYKK